MKPKDQERLLNWMLIGGIALILVLVAAFAVMADTYTFRDGYYHDASGQRYTRNQYVQNGCTYYSYAKVVDYVPKYVEPAKAYEAKYEDPFDASLGRAIETRAKADADIEKLVFQTNSQVQKLRTVLGGRGLIRGYDPYHAAESRGTAYAGDTRYATRTSTTYSEAYGKPIDLDAALARYSRGAENQIQAGKELQGTLGQLIDRAADRQTETARAIVQADGVTAKLEAMDKLLERFGEVLGKLDPPRETIVTQNVEKVPVSPPQPSGWQPIEVPLLTKYCGACHGGPESKAGYVLDGTVPLRPPDILKAQKAVQRQQGVKPMPPAKAVDARDVNGVLLELVSLMGGR